MRCKRHRHSKRNAAGLITQGKHGDARKSALNPTGMTKTARNSTIEWDMSYPKRELLPLLLKRRRPAAVQPRRKHVQRVAEQRTKPSNYKVMVVGGWGFCVCACPKIASALPHRCAIAGAVAITIIVASSRNRQQSTPIPNHPPQAMGVEAATCHQQPSTETDGKHQRRQQQIICDTDTPQ